MMRSMYAAVSGLRAQQTKMDVIGNNIANVNTIGYRGARVSFTEVFSQTMKGAGSPDAGTGKGGSNPVQVGLGMGIGAVDIVTNRGSLQRTDSPTDLAIEGDGFFIMKAGTADSFKFTRAGNFSVDKLGNVVGGAGYAVYGWQDYGRKANADGTYTFDVDKPIEAINIFSDSVNKNKRIIASKATSEVILAGNLDATKTDVAATDPSQFTVPMSIYDSLGNESKINMEFRKTNITAGTPTVTEWTWNVPDDPSTPQMYKVTANNTGTIEFDSDGQLVAAANPVVTFEPTASETGSDPFDVTFDFEKLTMYSADSSAKPTSIDGYPSGSLVTFNIGSDGMITGIYSNGKQQPLGLIGMAAFENPAGLQRVGDNMYIPTTNSGDFKRALKAGAEGVGVINPGTLEMSNVDLSKEFTEMIVTQRAFQANSRIMTSTDEMLQEVTNLKR